MKLKLSQDLSGNLRINGKAAHPQINGIFRMTTDTLSPWREDARERFRDEMKDAGLSNEARVILNAWTRDHATFAA